MAPLAASQTHPLSRQLILSPATSSPYLSHTQRNSTQPNTQHTLPSLGSLPIQLLLVTFFISGQAIAVYFADLGSLLFALSEK